MCPPSANYHTARRIKVFEGEKEQGLVLADSKNLAVFKVGLEAMWPGRKMDHQVESLGLAGQGDCDQWEKEAWKTHSLKLQVWSISKHSNQSTKP